MEIFRSEKTGKFNIKIQTACQSPGSKSLSHVVVVPDSQELELIWCSILFSQFFANVFLFPLAWGKSLKYEKRHILLDLCQQTNRSLTCCPSFFRELKVGKLPIHRVYGPFRCCHFKLFFPSCFSCAYNTFEPIFKASGPIE